MIPGQGWPRRPRQIADAAIWWLARTIRWALAGYWDASQRDTLTQAMNVAATAYTQHAREESP